MNSKERVLAAIHLATPDRIPIDYAALPDTQQRLMAALGVNTHADLLSALHVDIVDLRGVVDPTYCGPVPYEKQLPDNVVENFWGMRLKTVETATGPESSWCDFALANCTTSDELSAHRWPSVDWFDFSDFSHRLDVWSGLAVMASGPSVWQHPTFLRGIENLLMDMAAEAEMAECMMDRFTDFYVAYFDRMLDCANGKIDILRIADDLAMQDRLMISPAQFDRFFAPRLKPLIDMAHSHGVKVMFHSCGAIFPLVERLIKLGIDILDPLQVTADRMDPGRLKATFGGRLCLHGGIDTQYLLPTGSPEEVRGNVLKMAETLGPEGYILCPSHVLQTDVPIANILALYETACMG